MTKTNETKNQSSQIITDSKQLSKTNSRLKSLDKLVGTWNLVGKTIDSKEDNIKGSVTIEWILNRHFLQLTGVIEMPNVKMNSIEIVGYDVSSDTFPALVYGDISSMPISYYWDIQGNEVTHWTIGSKYTGHFSEDGKTWKGGWRPDKTEQSIEFAYNATMTKIT